jgi:hypothetical protein
LNASRSEFLRSVAFALVLLLPWGASAARVREPVATIDLEALDPAFRAMLGASAPESAAIELAARLRVVSPDGSLAPLRPALIDKGSSRYEASGLVLAVRTLEYGLLRLGDARVVLAPAADGKSCSFEVSGRPFGATSTFEASGTVTWSVGPLGGHRLEGSVLLDGAPVDALRELLPKRLDPSIDGPIRFRAKADGIVAELTTEDAPASPLRGDFDLKAEWTVLGRRAPVELSSSFSMDDRSVRLPSGRLKWMDFELAVKGWVQPQSWGRFDLSASFSNIDTQKVAAEWKVPEPWRPASTLSGTFKWKGVPGDSQLRYEATAPRIDLPALGGWSVSLDQAKLSGGILEVNTDVSVSFGYRTMRLGHLELPYFPGGLQWWRDVLQVTTANSTLWKGAYTATFTYKPEQHPAFSTTGKLVNAEPAPLLAALAPHLGLDADGRASITYVFGQDEQRKLRWTVQASLMDGRLANVDLVARVLEALAAADPALVLDDAASLLPKPRKGQGMAVDRLFFAVERRGDRYELGGLIFDSGVFRFEGDGHWSASGGLVLDGQLAIPEDVAARFAARAPWSAKLRVAGAAMLVPVTLRGPTSSPTVALAPGYAADLAKAARGESVTPPALREERRVGEENLPSVPGDPTQAVYE